MIKTLIDTNTDIVLRYYSSERASYMYNLGLKLIVLF